jgi:hypothetical protein
MPLLIKDRVLETASLSGTASVSLGGAKTGFRTFSSSFSSGDTTYYCIESADGAGEWEVGLGTLTSGSPWTLARTTVYASSNGGTAVNFTAGTKNVFCTIPQTAIDAKQETSGKDASGGYAGLTQFKLNLKNAANTVTNFFTNATTLARTWTLPDKDGTVAMTSDLTNFALDTRNAAQKTALVDADEFGVLDSAASYVLKRSTWGNLKSTLYAAPVPIANGGTNATSASQALTNLLPAGTTNGFVLTTSGPGSFYWAAAGAGGVGGTAISSSRVMYTATANQTLFTGVGTYTIGQSQLRVYINGVRQYPADYTETSTTSFTLTSGVPAGTSVMAEVDGYNTFTITAANTTYAAGGNIVATNVQAAITELDNEKAPVTSGTAVLKGNGTGGFSAAVAGTDFMAPATTINVGTTNFALNRASATQALTGLTVNGMSLAVAANTGTLTAGTSALSWTTSGTLGTAAFTASSAYQAAGTYVNSVGATAPVASSGGANPTISMAAASSGVNGYMTGAYATKLDGIATGATNVTNTNQLTNGAGFLTSATGVTSVNGAVGATTVQATLVSGTNIKTINSTSLLGSGDIALSSSFSYITSATASAGSYITFSGLSAGSGYSALKLVFDDLTGGDGYELFCQVSTGGTFITTSSYQYGYVGTGASYLGTNSSGSAVARFVIHAGTVTGGYKQGGSVLIGQNNSTVKHLTGITAGYHVNTANYMGYFVVGEVATSAAYLDGIRLYYGGGKTITGTVYLYGIKTS